MLSGSSPPFRQIHAHQPNPLTLTLYQAYNTSIATAAIATQKLSASPLFNATRMTWLKPSWCWVCYRSGYGQKDANQTHILALEVTREGFDEILSHGVLAHDIGKDGKDSERDGGGCVRVQWDPERGPALERYAYRSIQVGVKGPLVGTLVEEWVVGIEDVTERAKEMQRTVLKAEEKGQKVEMEDLVAKGQHPVETVYEVSETIAQRLGMDGR